MTRLSDLVHRSLTEFGAASVERAVFGTEDPEVIARLLEAWCMSALAAELGETLFYAASVGCVIGAELDDGRRIVIKVYQRRWSLPFLTAVARVQLRLADTGFPCPRPVLGPEALGPALATVEELLPDPGARLLAGSEELAVSARGLADQIGSCRDLEEPVLGSEHPLRNEGRDLYAEPHSPIFDFSLRADEARWIDELAVDARAVLAGDSLTRTVAHSDWSARNLRIHDGELRAVYDWDSLMWMSEASAVGQAAATWRSTGDADNPIAPGPTEVAEYLTAYENSAGRGFSPEERRVGMAAALAVLAYTARCEHALEAVTGKRVERARSRLEEDGRGFLGPRI